MKKGYFSKLPKDKLQKIVLICIVMLVAVVGVVEFYALNNWNALADTKSQIVKLNDQIRQAERKAREATQDVARRTELKTFVETQQAAMVSGDPFCHQVVREMSLLAEQEPVHLSGLHPSGKIETKSGTASYAARIDLSGTYDEIGTYVRDRWKSPVPDSRNTVSRRYRWFGRQGPSLCDIGNRAGCPARSCQSETGGKEDIMKSPVYPVIWAHRAWSSDCYARYRNAAGSKRPPAAVAANYESVLAQRTPQKQSLHTLADCGDYGVLSGIGFCGDLSFPVREGGSRDRRQTGLHS